MRKTLWSTLALAMLSAACSSSKTSGVGMMTPPTVPPDDAGTAAPDASPYIPGFNPPAAAMGYTRYVTPVIDDIGPGFDQIYCQWLTGPSDEEDVIDLTGYQSKWGHHIVLYAQTEVEPVGTSRVCTTDDMLGISFLGAIGGEGNTDIFKYMPPNTVFRVPKGQVLMANTHFLNSGTDTVNGQGVIDVEFQTPDPSRNVAGTLNNVGTTFSIPPHQPNYAFDVTCPVADKLDFWALTNHMHQYGSAVYTEVIHSDGTKTMVDNNTYWTADMEFNPPFVTFPLSALLTVNSGDKIHTHCEWTNTTDKAQTFPDEMCVAAFYDLQGGSSSNINCVDGQW